MNVKDLFCLKVNIIILTRKADNNGKCIVEGFVTLLASETMAYINGENIIMAGYINA